MAVYKWPYPDDEWYQVGSNDSDTNFSGQKINDSQRYYQLAKADDYIIMSMNCL